MTTTSSQKATNKAELILLKIPYTWDATCATTSQVEANPVGSRELARVQVSEYQSKIKDNLPTHYFLLIEGSIVPTVEWISANEFVYHA